jgi:hypothetical protein
LIAAVYDADVLSMTVEKQSETMPLILHPLVFKDGAGQGGLCRLPYYSQYVFMTEFDFAPD